MFLIYGVRNRQKVKKPLVVATCKGCGKEGVKQTLKTDTCGTLFFIPIVVANSKYYIGCPECGTLEKITKKKYKAIKELNKQKEVVYMSEVEQILAQQIGETLSTKDKMIRDIDEIMKKLAGISYEATAENRDRLKQAIKQNLAKTYSDEKLIAKTVEAYFANIITPKADK